MKWETPMLAGWLVDRKVDGQSCRKVGRKNWWSDELCFTFHRWHTWMYLFAWPQLAPTTLARVRAVCGGVIKYFFCVQCLHQHLIWWSFSINAFVFLVVFYDYAHTYYRGCVYMLKHGHLFQCWSWNSVIMNYIHCLHPCQECVLGLPLEGN